MPPDMHAILTDTPQLSAGAAVWLCLPAADFLKGRYVASNWDFSALEQRRQQILDGDLLHMKLQLGQLE